MSSCCRAVPCEELFGPEWARRDMEAYLRHGLGPLERQMVEELTAALTAGSAAESPAEPPALSEARVLEIGGGVGAIQAELLKAGAVSGEVIELVNAYAPFAARLAREVGVAGKTRFRVHDLLAEPDAVESADLVIMNRVVCCSADGLELAATAAGLTRHALVLSFPRSNWFTRGVAAAQRALFRLLGRSYRAFVWPQAAIAAAATTRGLQVRSRGGGLVWRYLLLVRGVTA
ncbi:MAG: hypothetical protein KF813_14030 [Trueperaceae bacterium]|nr:hypothetical protein [Trueperaceae bacterium]